MNDENPTPAAAAPDTAPAASETPDAVAEAEHRGYLRGLNEAARQKMSAPSVYQPGMSAADDEATEHIPVSVSLDSRRRSFWD